MIDSDGYRANVGIVITNDKKQILLAKRFKQNGWQLPQGGIDEDETELDALYRELQEEVGLDPSHVTLIAKTPKWLRYELPDEHVRRTQKPKCIGQKQVWYLLKLDSSDDEISLDLHDDVEFDDWKWVDYWSPVDEVINFKRDVYEDMLKALAPILFDNEHKIPSRLSRPLQFSAIKL
ncbi:MAG: RNA pyrophosphohydrolase [Candidatus Pseudothioglobus sp.]|mgnify:FL=1